jgi:hypothetical protein
VTRDIGKRGRRPLAPLPLYAQHDHSGAKGPAKSTLDPAGGTARIGVQGEKGTRTVRAAAKLPTYLNLGHVF